MELSTFGVNKEISKRARTLEFQTFKEIKSKKKELNSSEETENSKSLIKISIPNVYDVENDD